MKGCLFPLVVIVAFANATGRFTGIIEPADDDDPAAAFLNYRPFLAWSGRHVEIISFNDLSGGCVRACHHASQQHKGN